MSIPFLSKMTPERFPPEVGREGSWERQSADATNKIAFATQAGGVTLSTLARGVPSVWGHARFFQQAWNDKQHTNHTEVVELWRRFVTLAALRRRWPTAPITLKWIVVERDPPAPPGAAAPPAPTFKNAASVQWPHDIFGTPADQPVRIAAVMHDGEAIGLLLPGILAIPGRGLIDPRTRPASLRTYFPLENLDLPVEARADFYRGYLTREPLRDLAGFLKIARDELTAWLAKAVAPDPVLVGLSNRLREFQQDVLKGMGGAPPRHWQSNHDAEFYGLPARSAIRLFDVTSVGVERTPRAVLRMRPDLAGTGGATLPELILVADHVTDTDYLGLAVDAQNLVRDLQGRPREPHLRVSLASGNANGRRPALIVGEDELFEATLIRLPEGVVFSKHPGPLSRFLLPVTPLALAILGPQALLESLQISRQNADEVEFRLTVPLEGADVAPVELCRIYSHQQGTLLDAQVPDSFAVWPDFSIPSTAQIGDTIPTLVYQNVRDSPGSGGMPQFHATRLLTCAGLRTRMTAILADSERLSRPPRLLPHPEERGGVVAMLPLQEMLYSPKAVEAMQCIAGPASGLLLVHQRLNPGNLDPGLACTISIDFGTSSTTLAFSLTGRPPDTTLQPHVWLPFHQADLDHKLDTPADLALFIPFQAAVGNFIPPVRTAAVPFFSLLQVRKEIDPNSTEPLLRGRIPFPRETGTVNLADLIKSPPPGTDIELKLKWTDNIDERKLVRHLLSEVMLLALGHARARGVAASKIDWRFSLPRLLPEKIQSLFRNDAKAAFMSILERRPSEAELRFHWESIAVYSYLRSLQVEAGSPVMAILDIGGRSTDIAILNGKELCCDGSADLAGRVLLVDYWVSNWNEFSELIKAAGKEPLLHSRLQLPDPAGRVALVEILLSDPDSGLEDYVRANGDGRANALLAATRLRLQVGYLALVYLLVHHGLPLLSRRVGFDPARSVGVFLSGRGSRLFRMFGMDPRSQPTTFADRIDRWLRDAGFTNPTFSVHLSDHPKMEVAIGGLTCDETDADTIPTVPVALAVAGLAEAQRPLDAAPPQPGRQPGPQPGTIEGFCAEVRDIFLPELPSWESPAVRARVRSVVEFQMLHETHHPAFTGFTPHSYQTGQDPRRRFVLELAALLANWSELEQSPP